MIIVHFGRFFYAKKTARRKALPRLYSLPGELSSLRALSHSAISRVSLVNAKITCVERDPIEKHRNDLIGHSCSINDNPADNPADNHTDFATHHFHLLSRSALTFATKGYSRP